MVPIHDTDLAEDRWSQAEWENYELWEKVEVRQRRRKHIWIFGTVVLFLMLSSIPIVVDRTPKWVSRSYVRKIAMKINELKKEVSIHRSAFRLVFTDSLGMDYHLQKVENCQTKPTSTELLRSGTIQLGFLGTLARLTSFKEQFVVLSPDQGLELGVPGLLREICYDPTQGSSLAENNGFGVISVKDLTEKRLDRLTILLVSGPSAEISFD